MESEENRIEHPEDASVPGGRNPLKLVLGVLRALVPGVAIVLILNILNRGGWFSLLSGLSGMLLYSLLVFVEWISGQSLGRKTQHQGRNIVGQEARQAFLKMAIPWLLLYGLLTVTGGVGLFFLPGQQSPLNALISGAIGLLFCISVFRFGLLIGVSVLVLFWAERIERRLAPTPDAGRTEVEEGLPRRQEDGIPGER